MRLVFGIKISKMDSFLIGRYLSAPSLAILMNPLNTSNAKRLYGILSVFSVVGQS